MTLSIQRAFYACLGLFMLCMTPDRARAQAPTDLFFSEYIEGSSNNKALEIYNGTGATIDLAAGQYTVQMYFNGNTSASLTIGLTGSIAPGGTHVLAYTGTTATPAAPALLARANQTSTSAFYNGDDAIVLRKGGPTGTLLDAIGQVGLDPGTEWGTGLTSTADNTIRRKAAFCTGDEDATDAFNPATQWDGFANDTFDGLGAHTTNCGTVTPTLPTVSIVATDADGAEAGTDPIVFTISRTGSTTAALTVNYTIGGTATNGTDYTPALTGTAEIPVGQSSTVITLAITNDQIVDASETIILTVTANAAYSIGTAASATGTITDDEVTPSQRIHDIQGAAHISPLFGQLVSSVPGIVTGLRTNGFYMQDPTPDADDRTSEAIFVFTSTTPSVAVGTSVLVSGTVAEFRSGGSAGTNNLTITQIQGPTITTVSTGNALPAATVLGNGGRTIPNTIIEDQTGNVETGGLAFDPATDGIDFYESLEAMLVQINNPLAISPTAQSGAAAGELWVVADNGANATIKSSRGGVIVSANDFNPERIQLDDTVLNPPTGSFLTPSVNVGAQLGTVVGIVNWVADNFEVLITSVPTVISNGLAKEVTTLGATANQLTVSTFNVENLSPNDNAGKFSNLANRIVTNLQSPDILLLEEIQDNNGATNDTTVSASVTFQTLIAAISSVGGPTYQYRQINPVDDQDGGQLGGNIRVGFLFNPNRVSFVDRSGGTSTAATTINNVNGVPQLSFNPGRIDPTNPAFTNNDGSGPASNSRKPLVGEFLFKGQPVFIIGNHFSSKIPDAILFGVNQPATLFSEAQRREQATVVRNFTQSILAIDPNANVIVLGDLNDFEFSAPLTILKGAPLNALIETLPANERYTYIFEGNSQTIDHILVSNGLLSKLDQYDVVHINAEFVNPDSDHDPSVARFNFVLPVVASLTGSATICPGEATTLSVSVSGGVSPYTVVYTDGQSNTTLTGYTSGSPIAVAPTQTTTYSLVSVTDANGLASTNPTGTATITVQAPGAPGLLTLNGQSYPGGQSAVTVDLNTGNVSLVASGCAGTVSWTGPDNTSGTGSPIMVPTTQPGTFVYQARCQVGSCISAPASATVTVTGRLTVLHRDVDNYATNNSVQPVLVLQNQGSGALPLSALTLRYYLTVEGSSALSNLFVNYAQVGNQNVKLRYVPLQPAQQGASGYVEVSFTAGAGSLAAGANSGPIQAYFAKSDYGSLNEADDYSYNPVRDQLTASLRITAYYNGTLVAGLEPGSTTQIRALRALTESKNGPSATQINTFLEVRNEGNVPVNYSELKARYYFTSDGNERLQVEVDEGQVRAQLVKMSQAVGGADYYLELSFLQGGQLAAGASTGRIRYRISKPDGGRFNQANDYSYQEQPQNSSQNSRVVIYVGADRVWGTEPSGSARMASVEPGSQLAVTVLSNPVRGDVVSVQIKGAGAEPLQLQLVSAQGRVITSRQIATSQTVEQHDLSLAGQGPGVFLLQVNTATQSRTIRVLKAE